MQQHITCILCPMGCSLDVELNGGEVTSVKGNGCKRGVQYAHEECTAPTRMITALVALSNSEEVLSVKTTRPVPKSSVLECAEILRELRIKAPVNIGDVVLENILNTNSDIIATKTVR